VRARDDEVLRTESAQLLRHVGGDQATLDAAATDALDADAVGAIGLERERRALEDEHLEDCGVLVAVGLRARNPSHAALRRHPGRRVELGAHADAGALRVRVVGGVDRDERAARNAVDRDLV
jgi:hypothetical protein